MTSQQEKLTESGAAHVLQPSKVEDDTLGTSGVDLAGDGLFDGILLRGIESSREGDDQKGAAW